MKRKGFTLVELLVVIAIIALLMGILMPALARVRQIAYRMICGTNLSGIGKAMLIYSNDNEEDYPIAGGIAPLWGATGFLPDWDAPLSQTAYGPGPGAQVTIVSSLYLLIKTCELQPKQFICKGDSGSRAFELSHATPIAPEIEITDVWDFGGDSTYPFWPGMYCSYSYHQPYALTAQDLGYPINSTSSPGCPVAADRNPYLDKNTDGYLDGADPDEEAPTWNPGPPPLAPFYDDPHKTGNAAAHQREGQNVLFNDQHVTFEKYPNVGIQNDNIWKCWTSTDPPADAAEREGASGSMSPYSALTIDGIVNNRGPRNIKDAYLVSEMNRR